jgi:hypothetical protein
MPTKFTSGSDLSPGRSMNPEHIIHQLTGSLKSACTQRDALYDEVDRLKKENIGLRDALSRLTPQPGLEPVEKGDGDWLVAHAARALPVAYGCPAWMVLYFGKEVQVGRILDPHNPSSFADPWYAQYAGLEHTGASVEVAVREVVALSDRPDADICENLPDA